MNNNKLDLFKKIFQSPAVTFKFETKLFTDFSHQNNTNPCNFNITGKLNGNNLELSCSNLSVMLELAKRFESNPTLKMSSENGVVIMTESKVINVIAA